MSAPATIEVTRDNLPSVIEIARARLAEAKTSADVLEARRLANAAYHVSRVTKAANETAADCLVMVALAEMRLGREIEEGQERGEVATRADGTMIRDHVPNGNKVAPATYSDLGVTRKQVHEWKRTARAGEAVVRKAVADQLDAGRMPTKADIRRAVEAVVPPPPPRDPEKLRALGELANSADFKLRSKVNGAIKDLADALDGVSAQEVIEVWSREWVDPTGKLEGAVYRLADFFAELKEFLENG